MPKYRVTVAGARGSANTTFIIESDSLDTASSQIDGYQQYSQIVINTTYSSGTNAEEGAEDASNPSEMVPTQPTQRATINTPFDYGIVLGDDTDTDSAVHLEDDRVIVGVTIFTDDADEGNNDDDGRGGGDSA